MSDLPPIADDTQAEADLPPELVYVYDEGEDDDEGAKEFIGLMEIDAAGRLDIKACDAAREGFLRGVVKRMNDRRHVTLLTQYPPQGGESFSTGAISVARDDPGFGDALRRYLRTYYGLRLD